MVLVAWHCCNCVMTVMILVAWHCCNCVMTVMILVAWDCCNCVMTVMIVLQSQNMSQIYDTSDKGLSRRVYSSFCDWFQQAGMRLHG
jgi:hypothetical protein